MSCGDAEYRMMDFRAFVVTGPWKSLLGMPRTLLGSRSRRPDVHSPPPSLSLARPNGHCIYGNKRDVHVRGAKIRVVLPNTGGEKRKQNKSRPAASWHAGSHPRQQSGEP